jgi:site-specific DNA recombinase
MKQAVIYSRVSGKGQIEGYGFDRQEENIRSFAKQNSYHLVKVYREEGISGTTEEGDRPAFKEMIGYVIRENIDYIIIEGMDRLARELRVQENLCVYLASKGIQLVSANTGENITQAIEGDPMKKALIQIQGVFAELDKNQIVRKLRNGRDKARAENKKSGIKTLTGSGKCEGRKSYRETDGDLVKAARKQLKWSAKSGRKKPSLRGAAQGLFELGYMTSTGKPFSAAQVQRIAGKR